MTSVCVCGSEKVSLDFIKKKQILRSQHVLYNVSDFSLNKVQCFKELNSQVHSYHILKMREIITLKRA